jgi:Tfp pilus assembly protein PilX
MITSTPETPKTGMREPVLLTRQRGAAVLALSVIMLFLITIVTFYANKGAVLEQKISTNQLQYLQAYEAAQGGMDYALAWLATSGSVAWINDTSYPPYNQRSTSASLTQMIGNYTSTVTLWRNSARTNIVEIDSVSAGDATATVRQAVNLSLFTGNTSAPLTVNGCVVDSAAAGCIALGTLTPPPGAGVVSGAFAGTAWDNTFGISKTAMYALASNQAGGATGGPIYYYTDATVTNPWRASLPAGVSTPPLQTNQRVILIFDTTTCPKINGGITIYGTVYCSAGGDLSGTGGGNIYGSFIVDGPITKYTGNGNLNPDPYANITTLYTGSPISKITGSWRDF